MKAIAFDRDLSAPLLLPPEVTLISDSAITGPSRPVFIPDFDAQWVAEFYLALRISRLGKDISPKFAPRYFDRFTVAMRLVPVGILGDLREARRPESAVSMFDNALTPGSWQEITENADTLTVSVNDVTATVESFGCLAAEAVSAISRYATLKTGDIIMPCRVTPSLNIVRGFEIRVSAGDAECLSLKIH